MALLHRKGMDNEGEIEHENQIGKGRKLLVSSAIAIDMNGVIKLEKPWNPIETREEVIMYGSFKAGDGPNLRKILKKASKRRVMPCH